MKGLYGVLLLLAPGLAGAYLVDEWEPLGGGGGGNGDRWVEPLTGMEFVRIEGGCFQMGSPASEAGRDSDEEQHRVCVDDFALATHEVTVGQFRRFVQVSGYTTEAEKGDGCDVYSGASWTKKSGKHWDHPNFQQTDDHPVVCVSWSDAVAFTEWLSERSGKRFRLPTEAEWEYAARAGTTTARFWGEDADKACDHANVHDLTSKRVNDFYWDHHDCDDGHAVTAPVGSFRPNDWGLYDMLGNVWEWTCSAWDSDYGGEESKCSGRNRAGSRSARGGSWDFQPDYVRSASRGPGSLEDRTNSAGFRLAQDF
jgi:formylglycine-generating enzyme required for sulfatase activity